MSLADPDRDRAVSFGAAAEAYERSRPEYPDEAVDWLLPRGAHDVLDVGAGTGKLTRLIPRRAARVVAVDPSPEMLKVLRQVVPGVEAREGTAERIPLDDGSLDAVVCAQAWHWVDPIAASAEIGRVLRPGGTLGLIWNFRDRAVPWVALLDRMLDEGNSMESIGVPEVSVPFAKLERFETRWNDTLTPDELIDLVFSRSFMITANDERKAQVRAGLDALLAEHGDTIELPYVTVAFRATRP